jgi:uncharacterized protein (TIGR02266 family)
MKDKKRGSAPRPQKKPAPPKPAAPPPRPAQKGNAAIATAPAVIEDEVLEEISPSLSPVVSTPPAAVAPPPAAAVPVIAAPVPVVVEEYVAVFGTPPAGKGAAKGPAAADESEARNHKRFPYEIAVDIVSEHNFYAGLSLNISEGGLFVATHLEHPVGTKLEIRLLLPGDEEPTAIMTEVRWVRPHHDNADSSSGGLGLRFIDMTPELLTKVARFTKNRDPLYYDED